MIGKLTEQQRTLLAGIINTCGTGMHPFADDRTVDHFTLEYAIKCVDRALGEASDAVIDQVRELAAALKGSRS